MPTDIKLSKAQISKIIQSGGSFGSWLDSLDKKILTNVVIPLARDNLPGLVSNITSNAKKIISGQEAVRTGKRFTSFISNEYMNNIFKIIKLLEYMGVLFDTITETVKYEIKNKRADSLVLY